MLRTHPFAVRAHFKWVLALTYGAPAEQLMRLLPPGLELDTYNGFGFVALALVETEGLRPALLPRALGLNFKLAGYRLFVRLRTREGRNLRGLYILRSSTDRALMAWSGNLFTQYRYGCCEMDFRTHGTRMDLAVVSPGGEADLTLTADLSPTDPLLPGLVFPDERVARRYAGPLPFTFSYEARSKRMLVVEGSRRNWEPQRATVKVSRNTYVLPNGVRLDALPLAGAFHVGELDYAWARGRWS